MKTTLLSAVAALVAVSSVSAYSKKTNSDGTISTDVPFRCGSDWFDANKYCYKACPSGKDGECGYGQRCYRDLQNECDSYKDEDYGYDDKKKKEYKPMKEYKNKPKTKEYYNKPTTTEDYYGYEKTTTEEYYEQTTTAYGYKSTPVYYQATTTKGYYQAPSTAPSYKKSGKLMKAYKEKKHEKKYEKKYASDDSEQGYSFESTLKKGLYLSVSSYGGKLECKSEASTFYFDKANGNDFFVIYEDGKKDLCLIGEKQDDGETTFEECKNDGSSYSWNGPDSDIASWQVKHLDADFDYNGCIRTVLWHYDAQGRSWAIDAGEDYSHDLKDGSAVVTYKLTDDSWGNVHKAQIWKKCKV